MSNIKATQRNDVTSIRRSLHRDPDLAYLGRTSDANPEVFVGDRPGYWWVRELQAGGTTGPAIQVRGSLMPINPNQPGSTVVKLGIVEGEKAVLGLDFVSALAQGVNPTQSAVVDPNANNSGFVNQAFIATAYEQIVEGTLKVGIRGSVPLVAGVFVKVEGQVDFTGNVPTSGEHCVATTAVLSDLSGFEVQYSTPKPTGIPLDLDDLNEAWALMSDPLTNKPLWSWDIGDGQTSLIEANRWMDNRQFLNWESSGGGTGDVVGPASAVNDDLAAFDTTTGKKIKDSGLLTSDVSDAVSKKHTQNTDTGTTQSTWQLDSGSSGPKLKDNSGELQVRNAADSAFANIRVAQIIQSAWKLLIGGFNLIITHSITADRTVTFPDASGNALLDTATQNVSNKAITASTLDSSPVGATTPSTGYFTTFKIKVGGFYATITHAFTADRTVTLPGDANVTLVGTDTTQTLTNKTLTTPTIGDFSNATHNHTNNAGGGQITEAALSAPISIAKLADAWKLPVRAVASGTNINIASPGATIDGFSLSSGDRVLLTSQSTGSQNGIWVWNGSSSALTRPTDFASGSTLFAFRWMMVGVNGGSVFAGSQWTLSTSGTVTIDTTSQSWSQVQPKLMVGDSGSGGSAGIIPAPAAGDAVRGLFGDGTFAGAARILASYFSTPGDVANFDFTSIPATYSSLMLVLALRSDRANTNDNVYIRFNNDTTAANYYSYSVNVNSATPAFSATERLGATGTGIEINLGAVGNTGPANEFSIIVAHIFGYAQTGVNRTLLADSYSRTGTTTGNLRRQQSGASWVNTANAINRITVLPVTGANWKAGSAYMLYGLSS